MKKTYLTYRIGRSLGTFYLRSEIEKILSKSLRVVVFTVFHFCNDFEIELVGSSGTVHCFQKSVSLFVSSATKFGKYFKSIFSIKNFFKNFLVVYKFLVFSALEQKSKLTEMLAICERLRVSKIKLSVD